MRRGRARGRGGIAFVTNQELSGSQRLQLERSVSVAVELRDAVSGEFGFLSTRGLPRELRIREPRLSMANAFGSLRALLSVRILVIDALESISYRERRVGGRSLKAIETTRDWRPSRRC